MGDMRLHRGDGEHQFEPWLRVGSPNRRAGQGGRSSGGVATASNKDLNQPNPAMNCPNMESSKMKGPERGGSQSDGENNELS